MNQNGNSILSENICDLLLVWNVLFKLNLLTDYLIRNHSVTYIATPTAYLNLPKQWFASQSVLMSAEAHILTWYWYGRCSLFLCSRAWNILSSGCVKCLESANRLPGWRIQPTRGFRALVSPPLMSSRHRIFEPYGRWHKTLYKQAKVAQDSLSACRLIFSESVAPFQDN